MQLIVELPCPLYEVYSLSFSGVSFVAVARGQKFKAKLQILSPLQINSLFVLLFSVRHIEAKYYTLEERKCLMYLIKYVSAFSKEGCRKRQQTYWI